MMGWMHDTLSYFKNDPIHRKYHQNDITFSIMYAFTENFMLPLSHDEVVHGKGSLIGRMPGDEWSKFANLRLMYSYMFTHPGTKLLFMGAELGQWTEWNADQSLDWSLLSDPGHAGIRDLLRVLNRTQREHPALFERDFAPEGFGWLVNDDALSNVLAFARWSDSGQAVVCVANLSPVPREGYALTLPRGGVWRELLNTDALDYGGSGFGNAGRVDADGLGRALVNIPPLGVLWLTPES